MANIEVIHNNAYERLLEELDLEHVFEDNLKLDFMNGRVKYLKKYTHRYYKDSKKQFIYALILFTLFVENVSLFSQFYVINWFGKRNLLKDTNQQTKYTAREEDIHAKVGIWLVNTLRKEYPELFDAELKEKILQEAEEAYKAEAKIVDWMVNGIEDENLTADILKEFIKSRINDSLEQIGYRKAFEVDKELLEKTEWFDEEVIGNEMTDFFDGRPVEYAKSNKSFDEEDLF
jgi:ribonucleoside-diphosphate reductase beta chain